LLPSANGAAPKHEGRGYDAITGTFWDAFSENYDNPTGSKNEKTFQP